MPEKFIDANALTETLAIVAKKFAKSDAQQALMGRVFYILEHRPEGVVRCKDCKYLHQYSAVDRLFYCRHSPHGLSGINIVEENPFCSYGERKEYE